MNRSLFPLLVLIIALAFTACGGYNISITDGAGSSAAEIVSEAAPAASDRTGIWCPYGTHYINAELGFSAVFPSEWSGNYTPVCYSADDWYGTRRDWVEFCYKDDISNGPLSDSALFTVGRFTPEGWNAYVTADDPGWRYIGETADYVYAYSKPASNPYSGADMELSAKMAGSGEIAVELKNYGTVYHEYPVMTDEMMTVHEKYFPQGILYALDLSEDFDEQDYMTMPYAGAMFRYAYGLYHGDFDLIGSDADGWAPDYPAELVESTIQRYYLYTSAELRADSSYRAASGSYRFEGGYGGGYYEPVITEAREHDGLLELDISQYGDSYTGSDGQYILEMSCTLTIRPDDDGTWKYLANKVTYTYED